MISARTVSFARVLALLLLVALPSTLTWAKGNGNGVRCSYNSDCASNYCVFNICKSRSIGVEDRGNGVRCSYNSECASNYCVFNICKSRSGSEARANGVRCSYNSECASSYCVFNVCKDR